MQKIFLSILIAASVAASAQKVSNKLSFQQGQKLEVTTNMNMTSTTPMGESSGNIISVDEYTVAGASGTGTTLQKAIKKMKLNMSAMGRDFSIDSDNQKDMEGQMGAPIKDMMKNKYEFAIDGTGRVTSVKEDAKKKKDDNGMMGMMVPGLSDLSAAPKAGSGTLFKILPDGRELAKGDTWTDSLSENGNRSQTVYTLKDITDNELIVDFTQEGTNKGTQSAMGMEIEISGATKSAGTVTINRTTGIMKQRTATVTTDSNMNMGGQQMASTTKMTVVTTVKTI